MACLEFELSYFETAVRHFSLFATREKETDEKTKNKKLPKTNKQTNKQKTTNAAVCLRGMYIECDRNWKRD